MSLIFGITVSESCSFINRALIFFCFYLPAFIKFFTEKDQEKKKEMTKKFLEEDFPQFFKKNEDFLKKNGGQYFVGNEVIKRKKIDNLVFNHKSHFHFS